jgi:phage-related protein
VGGLAALAAGAAYAFGQFEESEKIAKQTDAVLKSTGDAANVTAGQVTKLAGALSEKAGIDDEAIQSGENLLLTFKNIRNEAGEGNAIFSQTTKAVLDMSVAMGQDMKSSAIQVGKALNDPINGLTSLTRVGVTFTDQQKKQITAMTESGNILGAQKIILRELTSEFGGSAAAQATASGKMQVALGNLAETVGKLLAPAFTFLAEKVSQLAAFLQANLGPALQAVGTFFSEHEALAKTLALVIGSLVVAFTAWTVATKIQAAAMAVFNAIAEANPWALIALAVIALAAVIISNWGKIKGFILPIFNVIKTVALAVWDVLKTAVEILVAAWILEFNIIKTVVMTVFDKIRDIVDAAWDFIKTGVHAVRDVFVAVWNGIKDFFAGLWASIVGIFRTAFNIMIGFINGIITGLNVMVNALDVSLGPFINLPDIPSIPTLDSGGMIAKTGLAVVHRGEAVIPPSAGFGGIHGDIVLQVDGATFARITRNEILKLKKRNGSSGI